MFRKLFALETAALLQQDDDNRFGEGRSGHAPAANADRGTGFPPGLGVWNPRASI